MLRKVEAPRFFCPSRKPVQEGASRRLAPFVALSVPVFSWPFQRQMFGVAQEEGAAAELGA